MKTIQVRLSDEEEASLVERVRLSGLSVSELVRGCLFPGNDAKLAQLPASVGQVNELSRRVTELTEAVGRLQKIVENECGSSGKIKVLQPRLPTVSAPSGQPEWRMEMGRVGAALREIYGLLEERKEVETAREATLVVTEKALSEVRESKRAADQMLESLRRFCKETLPGEVTKATAGAAEGMVRKCFEPLTTSAGRAADEIEGCLSRLIRIPWGARLLMGPVVTGVATGLVTVLIYHHLFISSDLDEIRRYADWGRVVERRLNKLPPKDHEKVLRMIGLRP